MSTSKRTSSSLLYFLFICFFTPAHSQLESACQLDIGTNLAGMSDFGTELPFVNLMRNARTWYTKDIGNPADPFDSGHAADLDYRSDGYPTHVPQSISASSFQQRVVTIWAVTDGWPAGQYTVLWEGTGTLQFIGTHQNLTQTNEHRITFDFPNPIDGFLELSILTSDINDPIRNIRVLMPGTESSYLTQPFNPTFIEKLLIFDKVRFMDWGQTNNWGQVDTESWSDPTLFSWSERSQMDHYTWAYEKGIPYEMMIKLMNDYDLDGWVCVPHRANDEYIQSMAVLFRDQLEPGRHLTVEYSNEIWNWIFGQTQWLNLVDCSQTGDEWPSCIAPRIQNCMDIFTNAFAGQLDRITRAVGVFTAVPYISNEMTSVLTPGSFDAIAPSFYFPLTEDGDTELDQIGSNADVEDIAFYARQGMIEAISEIRQTKTEIADPLGVSMVFYEGGQHLTPHPFGQEPSYAQALLDIQRDPLMFTLYNEWFDSLRTLQDDDIPLQLMHFSFVTPRSAQFGSWGMLEQMDQDTNAVYAPKYSAVLQNKIPDGVCENALSVELANYYVEGTSCSNSIFWSTETEVNNQYFIIERSTDGNNFTEIAKIAGAINSSHKQQYHFKDSPLSSGQYYYQITQVDLDGSAHQLAVRAVNLECKDQQPFTMFPNPATNQLNIVLNPSGNPQRLQVLDIAGQVLNLINLDQYQESVNLDLPLLPRGIYLVQLIDQSGTVSGQTLVKQ